MAKKSWYYASGDWNAYCDVCKMRFKASELRERWDGYMVCSDDWEPRHSMDFIRARNDQISVPWVRSQYSDFFTPVSFICTPDGITAISDRAVADCSICDKAA